MPHFAITLAGTRPSPAPQRLASLALLAAGSLLAVGGVTLIGGGWAAAGAAATVAGLVGVGWHTMAPLREPLARRHPVVAAAYGLALLELGTGVVLGGLGAAGVEPVLARWSLLRPAHAWLTLFGAVSLTIFATLVYLAPTVLGARIRAGRALIAGVTGIGLGPVLAALGFWLDGRPMVIAGMALTLVGAVGQIAYVVDCLRRRGRFTSEHDWRAVAIGHLSAGPAWFAAALAVALSEVIGARPLSGWALGTLGVPLVAGWMLQELVGSWTHLAPSVTVGGPDDHARQRRHLAVAQRTRLLSWNLGVGLAWVGLAWGASGVAMTGLVLLGAAVALSVAGLARALTVGRY